MRGGGGEKNFVEKGHLCQIGHGFETPGFNSNQGTCMRIFASSHQYQKHFCVVTSHNKDALTTSGVS